jgi:hypothetical protein
MHCSLHGGKESNGRKMEPPNCCNFRDQPVAEEPTAKRGEHEEAARQQPRLCHEPTKGGKLCQKTCTGGHTHCHHHGRRGNGGRSMEYPECCAFAGEDEDIMDGDSMPDPMTKDSMDRDLLDEDVEVGQEQLPQHQPNSCKGVTINGKCCQSPPKGGHNHCRHHGYRETNGAVTEYPKCCGLRDEDETCSEPTGVGEGQQLEHCQLRQDRSPLSHTKYLVRENEQRDDTINEKDQLTPMGGPVLFVPHPREFFGQSSPLDQSLSVLLQDPPCGKHRKSRLESQSPNPTKRRKTLQGTSVQKVGASQISMNAQNEINQLRNRNDELETLCIAAREDANGLYKQLDDQRHARADEAQKLRDELSTTIIRLESSINQTKRESEALQTRLIEQDRESATQLDQQKSHLDREWEEVLKAKLVEQATSHEIEMENKEVEHQKQLEAEDRRATKERERALLNQKNELNAQHQTTLAARIKETIEGMEKNHWWLLISEKEKHDKEALQLKKEMKEVTMQLRQNNDKLIRNSKLLFEMAAHESTGPERVRTEVTKANRELADLSKRLEKTKAEIVSVCTNLKEVQAELTKAKADFTSVSTKLEKKQAEIASESANLEGLYGQLADVSIQIEKRKTWMASQSTRIEERNRRVTKILCLKDRSKVQEELKRFTEEEGIKYGD